MLKHDEEIHCAGCWTLLMRCKFAEFVKGPQFLFCSRECADDAKVVEEIRERIEWTKNPQKETRNKPLEWREVMEIADKY